MRTLQNSKANKAVALFLLALVLATACSNDDRPDVSGSDGYEEARSPSTPTSPQTDEPDNAASSEEASDTEQQSESNNGISATSAEACEEVEQLITTWLTDSEALEAVGAFSENVQDLSELLTDGRYERANRLAERILRTLNDSSLPLPMNEVNPELLSTCDTPSIKIAALNAMGVPSGGSRPVPIADELRGILVRDDSLGLNSFVEAYESQPLAVVEVVGEQVKSFALDPALNVLSRYEKAWSTLASLP